MNIALVFVVLYLCLTVTVSLTTIKKKTSARSFHGANLGILLCVAAGAGEWMGGTSTTGVSEYGYLFGISGSWYTIANGIGIMFCAIFFARLYRSLSTPTVSGIVGHYIGPNAKSVSAVLLILVMLVVGVSQMTAIGSLGKVLFNIDIKASILILGAVVILYTLFGGMLSVSYTNMMHLIVMYAGIIAAVVFALHSLGGIAQIKTELPESYFSFASIGGDKIGSWIIASVLGACTAQAGIQPVLAARNEKTAVVSSVMIAMIVAPFGILSAFLGMAARIWFPEMENAKLALPALLQNMPVLTAGLVTAAMTAAILSTAAPILLACGTLFTKDVYLRLHPGLSSRKELQVSRIATSTAGVLCVLMAILMYYSATVLDIVYFAYSLRGSLFVILLFGIFSRKQKPQENPTIAAMILTAATGLFWTVWKAYTGSYPIAPWFSDTYASICTAVLSMTIVCFAMPARAKNK